MFGIKKLIADYRDKKVEEAKRAIDAQIDLALLESQQLVDGVVSGLSIADVQEATIARLAAKIENTLEAPPIVLTARPKEDAYRLIYARSYQGKCAPISYFSSPQAADQYTKDRAIMNARDQALQTGEALKADAVYCENVEGQGDMSYHVGAIGVHEVIQRALVNAYFYARNKPQEENPEKALGAG